jgi:hypothetical protein
LRTPTHPHICPQSNHTTKLTLSQLQPTPIHFTPLAGPDSLSHKLKTPLENCGEASVCPKPLTKPLNSFSWLAETVAGCDTHTHTHTHPSGRHHDSKYVHVVWSLMHPANRASLGQVCRSPLVDHATSQRNAGQGNNPPVLRSAAGCKAVWRALLPLHNIHCGFATANLSGNCTCHYSRTRQPTPSCSSSSSHKSPRWLINMPHSS